jgi:solute carrier family 50 protein (sugar transporter)
MAGPVFFLGLQGSSLRTAMDIMQNQSVGGYSLLPFASLLTNCIIWAFYGILKEDYTVLVPNIIGTFNGLVCVAVYKTYSSSSDLPISLCAFAILLFAGTLFISDSANTLGLLGCGIAVVLMGSPLGSLSTVIREKSTASMPFFTSFTTWCNALSWSLYGLLVANDRMIYGPNILGFALASIQMGLFVLYGFPKETHLQLKKDSSKDISNII